MIRPGHDLISAGDIDGFGALLADDFVDHEELPGLAPTKEGAIAFFRMYVAAFPDLRMAPEDVIASGDKVVARVRATGTHKGATRRPRVNAADQALRVPGFHRCSRCCAS